MALTWDLQSIDDTKNLCWIKQEDGTTKMNGLTETLIWATMFCCMNKISKQTYKDFHRRLIELEIASGGKGLLWQEHIETGERSFRSPTLEEVEAHIGLSTNATTKNKREWGNQLKRIVQDEAQTRITALTN